MGCRDRRFLGQAAGLALFVWLVGAACAPRLYGAQGGPSSRPGQLPVVIPHPQSIRLVEGGPIVFGENGRSVAETVAAVRGGFFEEAEKLIDSALKKHGLADRSGEARTRLVLQSIGQRDVPQLTPHESAALARSDQAYVIRSQPGRKATVWIIGASPLGAYYGATTLVQLITAPRPGAAVMLPVEIRDWPDIPFRMAADWVLRWDWDVNGYDWGDGLAAFLARCKRKIDLCSQYKVNRVRFLGGRIAPGPAYMPERYEKIKRFALELNRYARRKGVALQFSSSSWGQDYYNWGLPYPEPWILNRESYPDGPVYSCVGGTVGGCFSNEALIRRIADRHKQLVRDVEPGSIYLHQIDAATYAELVQLWKSRCPRCRQRFPDAEPFSARGYAAAVAHLYNAIIAELKSVRNPQSGYDASRDLEIVFASPGYSYSSESDAEWEKDLKYFAEIGRQLTDRKNVQITFREQYQRFDDRGLRIREMADALAQAGWPRAPFVFAVQGGGFIFGYHMFVSSPVLTATDSGAATLYNFNGHVHSELQVLANVNYAWNCRAPGSVDPAGFHGRALQDEASRYAAGVRHSDFLYGRFLDSACAALYGGRAGPCMAALLRLEREKGPILAVPAWVDYQWNSAGFDWRAQAERNLQAKPLVDKAIAACDTDARPDLVWLGKCLEVATRLCRLCDAVYREKRPRAEIEGQAAALLGWLEQGFPFQATEPDGGDPGLWKNLVLRIAKRP